MTEIKTISVQAGQNIWDIAIQEYGNAEAVMLILQANPGLGLTDTLTPGQSLLIWSDATTDNMLETIELEPYKSKLQSLLMAWAALVLKPSGGGGTTSEYSSGFGVDLANFIFSLNLDQLHATTSIRAQDQIIFIYVDDTGTNRYRRVPLSNILSLFQQIQYLSQLSDVEITTPALGNLLKFDGVKWINDPVLGIAELSNLSSTNPLLYLNTTTHKLAWLDFNSDTLEIDSGGKLNVKPSAFLWEKVLGVIKTKNAENVDLQTGNLRGAILEATTNFAINSKNGITEDIGFLTGCTYDLIGKKLIFTRRQASVEGGIIVQTTALTDLEVTL